MVEFEEEQQNKRPLEDDGMTEDGSNKRTRTGNETVEVDILVPSTNMGKVIGKGGETIKNIRAETGASINTSKFVQNLGERTSKVTGSAAQVLAAIKMIIDTIGNELPSITFLAEHRNLGALIGKQGANIKKLREETGAKIFIPKECIGNSTQKEIQISGDYLNVMEAVESVICYLAESTNPTRISYIPGNVLGYDIGRLMPSIPSAGVAGLSDASVCRIETTVWVPKEVIGQIIGRGGAKIRAVRMQSTAHVNIVDEDGDESPERKITIKGSRQAIDMACCMIENLANQRR